MDEKQNIPEPEVEHVDNAFELGAYLIKNWWKGVILIAVLALALTGYEITCGNVKINHEPIKQLDEVK